MKFLANLFDLILKGTVIFGCALVVLMAISICYGVLTRYFFDYAPLWVNDFTEYALLGVTFLGAAYVLKEDRHIEVDLVTSSFCRKNQLLLKMITSSLGAAICLLMTWYGFETVWDNYVRKVNVVKTLDFPKFIPLLLIAVGCVLLSIQFIRRVDFYRRARRAEVIRIEKIHEGVA